MAEHTLPKLSAIAVAEKPTDWTAHNGATDMWVAIINVHVWSTLGWHDIRQRYRRSILGPFWFTLSTFILVAVLGLLYSKLLNQDIKTYLPYLSLGLVLWQYLSTSILEGANGLIAAENLIKQIRMPVTTHICRIVWRNFCIMLHSLPVVFLFSLAMGNRTGWEFLMIIPGIFLLLLTGVWTGVLFGILCLRYRDILPIVTSLIQVAFFFTPIMWTPELLKDRSWIADFNPLYHLIQLVRAPLLGESISPISWVWAIGLVIVGFGLAQALLKAKRHKLTYWL
jgi:lipopolysaccharide transport system permease protein